MKKKAYISPATQIFHVNMSDGILVTLSGDSLNYQGETGDNDIEDSDTKYSGDWGDIWD